MTKRLGIAVYTTLSVLAAVFYLERMAWSDMAFQTFHILRTGDLQIQSGRFGAAGTQVFGWLAQALGLPLKGVLLSYSVGHVLYYFTLFLIVTLGFRQWKWGLVLILFSTLMTTQTFYWLSEMPQGVAFFMLPMAWLHARGRLGALRMWEFPLLAACLVTAFYFHPMVLYAALFCAAFFILQKDTQPGWRTMHAAMAGVFLLAVFVKYKVLKLDWYDAMSLERAKAFSELWPQWFDIQSNRDLLRWCLRDYYLIPLLILSNTIFYLWKRLPLKAGLALLFPIGYALLVNVPFHRGDNQFYLENLYLPLALFVAVPLVFDVLPAFFPDRPARAHLVVAVLALAGIVRIWQAHASWTERIRWEQSFLEKTAAAPQRKLVVPEQQVPMDRLLFSWGSAYEFLLLSALEHPDSARCILIDESPERFDSLLNRPGLFLGEFKNYRFEELPRRYFHLTDTSAYVRWQGQPN